VAGVSLALTTAVELELANGNLVAGFDRHREIWLDMAREAYRYTKETVVGDPKQDDVAPHLALALRTRKEFLDLKSERRLTAKRWFDHFADLIIARTWHQIAEGGTT
jgi:hypothetical protein